MLSISVAKLPRHLLIIEPNNIRQIRSCGTVSQCYLPSGSRHVGGILQLDTNIAILPTNNGLMSISSDKKMQLTFKLQLDLKVKHTIAITKTTFIAWGDTNYIYLLKIDEFENISVVSELHFEANVVDVSSGQLVIVLTADGKLYSVNAFECFVIVNEDMLCKTLLQNAKLQMTNVGGVDILNIFTENTQYITDMKNFISITTDAVITHSVFVNDSIFIEVNNCIVREYKIETSNGKLSNVFYLREIVDPDNSEIINIQQIDDELAICYTNKMVTLVSSEITTIKMGIGINYFLPPMLFNSRMAISDAGDIYL